MALLSPWGRRIAFLQCILRDGEKCKHCGKVPVRHGKKITDPTKQVRRLVLAHVDDDPTNNPKDGSNHLGLCDSCNNKMKKKPRKPRGNTESRFKELSAYIKKIKGDRRVGRIGEVPAPMARGDEAVPFFRAFVENEFRKDDEIEEEELLNSAVNAFFNLEKTINKETLRNYLNAMCNPRNGDYTFREDKEAKLWFVRKRT